MLFRRELIRVLFMLHEFSASLVCSPPCRLFLVVWRTYIDGFVGWWDDMSRLHGDVSTSGASSVQPCVLRGLYCSVVGKGTDMSHLPKTDETNRDLDSLGRFHHFILDLVLICLWKEKRQLQGLNLRGETPSDFKSDALTTRPNWLKSFPFTLPLRIRYWVVKQQTIWQEA